MNCYYKLLFFIFQTLMPPLRHITRGKVSHILCFDNTEQVHIFNCRILRLGGKYSNSETLIFDRQDKVLWVCMHI